MSILDPEDIKARCAALRLPVLRLAAMAGLNKHTVHRIFDHTTSPRLDTLRALSVALEAEERRVLAHLAGLHPSPVTAAPRHPLPERERDVPHLNGVAA
jgi:predicted transcriptional regulator